MPYADYTEVIERYPSMASWGDVQSEVASLTFFAENQINGMLASAFDVPFSGAHPTIKDLTIDWTYYKALVTRDPGKAEKIRDYLMGRIEALKNGEESIMTDSGTSIIGTDASQEVWTNTGCWHPTHSMLDAENEFTMISSDRLEYDEDERKL
jgi:hypothetical protein